MAHQTWNLARNYMVRMGLGMPRLATISGSQRTFVLAPCNPGLLAVATQPSARLGLISMKAEAARNLLVNL